MEFDVRVTALLRRIVFVVCSIVCCSLMVSCSGKYIPRDVKTSDINYAYLDRDYPGREKFITIDGIRVCYVDNNHAAKHTLIFLHGLSLSIHNFRFNYPAFFDEYRVVALDFPGFGKSEIPNVSYSIDFFTKFLAHFMDELDIDKAVLIGNSLGSHVGIEFAIDYPDRVTALVIESATGIRPRLGMLETIVLKWYITESRFKDVSEEKMREHIEWSWYDRSPASEELVGHRIHFRRKYYDTLIYEYNNIAFVRGLWHVIHDTVRHKVDRIDVPALVIWGRYDKVTGISDAYYLHRKIKGSQLVFIDKAGHLAHIERPEPFNDAVRKFLNNTLYSNRHKAKE